MMNIYVFYKSNSAVHTDSAQRLSAGTDSYFFGCFLQEYRHFGKNAMETGIFARSVQRLLETPESKLCFLSKGGVALL